MLSFVPLSSAQDSVESIESFNPHECTWILSDLKSKQEIQDLCFKKFGFYTDDSILRMSDFCKLWVKRLHPELQFVSDDFIEILVKEYVEKYKDQLNLDENSAQTISGMIQLAAPVMISTSGFEFMNSWISDNSEKRWVSWYKIAQNALKYLVWEKKVVSQQWCSAILLESDLSRIQWKKSLRVDLGAQVKASELAFLKELSQKIHVEIFVPSPAWKDQFHSILKNYDTYLNFGKIKKLNQTKDRTENSETVTGQYLKFSNQLGEVKFAVSKVREWLDQKIDPSQIAIISPKIEDYWPVIEDLSSVEGLPLDKDRVSSLGSLAIVQSLVSHLQSLSHEVSFESLQTRLFHSLENPQLRFEKFKSLFAQLYDAEDLRRDQKIESLFFQKLQFGKKVQRDEFISLVVKIWIEQPGYERQPQAIFEAVIKDILTQSIETQLYVQDWWDFLKKRLAKKEIKVAPKESLGIKVVPLASSQHLNCPYRIYIGLVDEFLRQKSSSLIPTQDIENIKKSSDFDFIYNEVSDLEFDLKWYAELPAIEKIFTTPEFSFSSDPLNASLFFLENEMAQSSQNEVHQITTRFDQLRDRASYLLYSDSNSSQESTSSSQFTESLSTLKFSVPRIKADLAPMKNFVQSVQSSHFSASSLSEYGKCHFKWLAAKGFGLLDLSESALTLDPRQKGNMTHSLFEWIVEGMKDPNWKFETSWPELNEKLNQKRLADELFINGDAFWEVEKKKLCNKGRRFFENESQRPRPESIQTEWPFEFYYSPETKKFTSSPGPGPSIQFKGRIDRVDRYLNLGTQKWGYVIYDYKSKENQKSYKSWTKDREFQMWIYTKALQIFLEKQTDSEILAVMYYNSRNFKINKGWAQKDFGQSFFGLHGQNQALIDIEDWSEKSQEFEEALDLLIQDFSRGDFTVAPVDENICQKCNWREMCRFHQMN